MLIDCGLGGFLVKSELLRASFILPGYEIRAIQLLVQRAFKSPN